MVFIADILSNFDGSISKALPIILAVFLLSGLLQIVLGLIGIGKYIRYIPYPVVSGFMTAIGVIILVTQIAPTVGYYVKEDKEFVKNFKEKAESNLLQKSLDDEISDEMLVLDDFESAIKNSNKITESDIMTEARTLASKEASGVLGTFNVLPRIIKNIDIIELLLAFFTIAIIYGFKKVTTVVPSTLVALFVVSAVAYGFGINYRPISAIPSGLPEIQYSVFKVLDISLVIKYVFTAITLALLGAIDSLLTSIVADNMTKTIHEPNKELIGQGIGNSIGALFGGIPGAGATIRTVVNINSGGKTRLSGMIAGLLLLFILLAVGPIASKIPAAVLAGILITVGIGVMDYKGLKAIPYMPKPEVFILLIVLVLSSIWNLVYAVGIGLVIASLIFMKKVGDLTSESFNIFPIKKGEFKLPSNFKDEIFIKDIEGPLFFGSSSNFNQTAKQIPSTISILIIRLKKVPYIDQSGLYALESVIDDLISKDKKVFLVGLNEQPKKLMEKANIIPSLIPEEQIFNDFESTLLSINKS
tara:strand:+ start:285 stop:1874 length:1590 start_codon:yes stop_codon:yes gene_type:complete